MVRVDGNDRQAAVLVFLIDPDQPRLGRMGNRAMIGGENHREEFGFLEIVQGHGSVIDADQFERGGRVADAEFLEAGRVLATGAHDKT